MEPAEVVKQIEAALEHEPRVNLHRGQLEIAVEDGVATLSGEVETLAEKRLTLERTAALPQISGVVDRLHVRPAEQMGDGDIADHVERDLTREPAFDNCAIARQVGEVREVVRPRDPDRQRWWIDVRVDDGVVTLDGEVPSLTHKRLAGAMAWWVPGSRDVVNGLGVEPDEADTDDEILDALRVVLEKDPFVDASQIAARCENAIVTLEGYSRNETERNLVEFDAWAVFGVDDVLNHVLAGAP